MVKNFSKSELTFTGPTLDIANARQVSLSAEAPQNVDTLDNGYDGQVVSLYGASAGIAFTIRDSSVSGGNIELISNGTYVLQNGTSNNAITLVYRDDLSSWVQSS